METSTSSLLRDMESQTALRELVRRARVASRDDPSRTVWDHLAQASSGHDLQAQARLAERIQHFFDVDVILTEPADVVSKLDACDAVVLSDGVIAAADPWEPAIVQAANAAGLTEPLRLAMASGSWLRAHLAVDPGPGPSPQGEDVVAFVDRVLHDAFTQGASDVHVEATRNGAVARLRLDGVLSEHSRLAGLRRAEEAVSRIKVLAKLDITERRVPQDGRLTLQLDGRLLDLRVSIMPSIHAEDAVLRLLDKSQLRTEQDAVTLDVLGFDAPAMHRLRELAALPHGMILVTGPTGSGKTTTVYAILSEVNTGLEKIVTIEDPVEYELPGVLQIPVNERKGLTFAKGLRSILRHDPDRILVGEIRDAETAEIAVQSALTGHQVFTTVHANSIFDVTSRFRHFGLDMFGFMSALNGVVVQRLVRKLCGRCKRQVGNGLRPSYSAVGCEVCRHTGYQGRIVIAEVHTIDDTLRDLVTDKAALSVLKAHIAASDVKSLAQVAATYIAEGLTTPEEVRRVIGWSSDHV